MREWGRMESPAPEGAAPAGPEAGSRNDDDAGGGRARRRSIATGNRGAHMAKRKTPKTPPKIERARVQVVRDPLDAEISRRQFLTGLAATTGAIALANCGG